MRFTFVSDYIPLPEIRFTKLPPNGGYKIKIYRNDNKIDSLRHEFEKLYRDKYTHVVNIPGKYEEILRIAQHFGIVYLNSRTVKYVAERSSYSMTVDS